MESWRPDTVPLSFGDRLVELELRAGNKLKYSSRPDGNDALRGGEAVFANCSFTILVDRFSSVVYHFALCLQKHSRSQPKHSPRVTTILTPCGRTIISTTDGDPSGKHAFAEGKESILTFTRKGRITAAQQIGRDGGIGVVALVGHDRCGRALGRGRYSGQSSIFSTRRAGTNILHHFDQPVLVGGAERRPQERYIIVGKAHGYVAKVIRCVSKASAFGGERGMATTDGSRGIRWHRAEPRFRRQSRQRTYWLRRAWLIEVALMRSFQGFRRFRRCRR